MIYYQNLQVLDLQNTYTRIGGLEFDLYDGFDKDLEEVLKHLKKR